MDTKEIVELVSLLQQLNEETQKDILYMIKGALLVSEKE